MAHHGYVGSASVQSTSSPMSGAAKKRYTDPAVGGIRYYGGWGDSGNDMVFKVPCPLLPCRRWAVMG